MRAAIIKNGKVVNIIAVASLNGHIDATGANIGDAWDGSRFIKPVRAVTMDEHNAPILAALEQIDAKSIRALREGDATRSADYEAQAAALRLQLRKE